MLTSRSADVAHSIVVSTDLDMVLAIVFGDGWMVHVLKQIRGIQILKRTKNYRSSEEMRSYQSEDFKRELEFPKRVLYYLNRNSR